MASLLSRVVDGIRAWLGLDDSSENRLHPSHGWLLPPAGDVRAFAQAPALSPSSVSSAPGKHS
jgi:hypothetical protein